MPNGKIKVQNENNKNNHFFAQDANKNQKRVSSFMFIFLNRWRCNKAASTNSRFPVIYIFYKGRQNMYHLLSTFASNKKYA